MINVMTKTRQKVVALAVAGFAAAALGLAATATPAYASDTPWNENVTVTAHADNPNFLESEQYVDVTMTFANGAPWTDSASAATYLQANTKIANRTIAADSDGYTRLVSDVVVGANSITFTIGPNQDGMTANYSGELYIEAAAGDATGIAAAMGNKPVETLVDNGITISKVSGNANSSVFSVDTRAQARAMNHILITKGTGEDATAIFSGSGTFSNGGITIHSHNFSGQTVVDYAAATVSAGNAIENSDWVFTDLGNGQFSISNSDPDVDCSDLSISMYDCDYLNIHQLPVGQIFEHELDEDGNPVD